ncbi:hypothetical protein [Paraburkholderia caballeronis]|uniref:hypothetical protein n=1 Tax=Paraburkholderia caballeronis TaxID=416943 RepID=UPI0010652487|nr:hypothetical protein [Paraburkholderia caballeronis]
MDELQGPWHEIVHHAVVWGAINITIYHAVNHRNSGTKNALILAPTQTAPTQQVQEADEQGQIKGVAEVL